MERANADETIAVLSPLVIMEGRRVNSFECLGDLESVM